MNSKGLAKADFYINGHHLGLHENGVMAVGFDITPYITIGKENVVAVRTDNDWRYKEKSSGSRYQWNDKNFNANYGGIPKNVWLHISDPVYQTLPLYSQLGTTGTYVYATDIKVKSRTAIVNAETEVKNDAKKPVKVSLLVSITDNDGKQVASFRGDTKTVSPGATAILKGSTELNDIHFGVGATAICMTSPPLLKSTAKSPTRSRPLQDSAKPALARARSGSTTACFK